MSVDISRKSFKYLISIIAPKGTSLDMISMAYEKNFLSPSLISVGEMLLSSGMYVNVELLFWLLMTRLNFLLKKASETVIS